jgi:tRNA (cmo5U34)-methyltransferase
MGHSVKQHLDVDVAAYDAQIRRFIPHYEEMLATGVQLLAALVPADAQVLDLGGGTGGLSAAVLDGMPDARVTLLDVDPAMLDQARRRLAPFGDRVTFHEGSFLDPLPGADAIVASLALHHVRERAAKDAVYRAILAALAPGGAFLSLDAAVTEDERLRALVLDRWVAHMGEHGISAPEGHDHIASWADGDRYFPLDVELEALRDAGFTEVECFYRRGPQAICCALR